MPHSVDMSNISSIKLNADRLIWSHYSSNVSSKLKIQVDVLEDGLMLREDKSRVISFSFKFG